MCALQCRLNDNSLYFLGFPDFPLGLHQNASLNTESSAAIQWRAPLYTGGDEISVMSFIVRVNGRTISVKNSGSDMFTHTITELQYNTDYNVKVTTNNSCGRESNPGTVSVRIDARG